jgi:hypothetical protein
MMIKRRVPFSCFALPNSFLAVPSTSGPVFIFCALGLIFSGTEGVGSHFHVLRARTHFLRYRGLPIPFSYFSLPNMFSVVPRASGIVFEFCVPELVFGGTAGIGSRFHVLRARTLFRRYRGRRFPFSCFERPNSFSTILNSFPAIPRASGPVFMFCALGLFFGGTEGVGSSFNVLRSQIHFRRCRVRRVPFSCFGRPDSFSAVPRASDPVFMFSATGHVFGSAEGVRSRFHVLRSRTRFRRFRGRRVPFYVLNAMNLFWRNRGSRLTFSCFAFPNSFSAVRRVPGPVFMFCEPGLVFDGTKGIGSCFHILRPRTCFRRY